MNQVHSSVILVTGAATGIGQLSAHSLAEAGHIVYSSMHDIKGRNVDHAQKERDYAQSHHVDLRVVELDVTSQDSANQVVQTILAEQDHIDTVLHSAGHLFVGYMEAFSAEEAIPCFKPMSWELCASTVLFYHTSVIAEQVCCSIQAVL